MQIIIANVLIMVAGGILFSAALANFLGSDKDNTFVGKFVLCMSLWIGFCLKWLWR